MSSSNLIVGASPPPLGVSPNFTNPESNAWQIDLAAALPVVFVFVIYLLRVYTSRCITKRWYLDDGKHASRNASLRGSPRSHRQVFITAALVRRASRQMRYRHH